MGMVCLLVAAILPGAAFGQTSTNLVAANSVAVADGAAKCRIIYLGFVGALEPAENKSSGVVQIRETLQGPGYGDVCAKSFSPYVWTAGRDWLLGFFPRHGGALTAEEIAVSPRVILVGHSMGGWAAVSVARELRGREIPVELMVQVDSVGMTDFTVPRNVRNAAVFHANDVLMWLTTKHVRLEDARRTTIVADVRVKGVSHQSITRDARIRELVMGSVERLRRADSLQPTLPSSGQAADSQLGGGIGVRVNQ
jgi:pimeloyl-ACP methyl ester carboxylesterase